LRAVFFVLLLPGTVAGYLPLRILRATNRLSAPDVSLFSVAAALVGYMAVVFVLFHLFVVLYEEPALESRFGQSYRNYHKAVPRWGFTVRPFSETPPGTARHAGE
jgi:protein-S-isoprenylcysteine O-methyltransferase Ste14